MEHNLEEMKANKRIARVAGLWYLLLAITAAYNWMYITGIFVAGNLSYRIEWIELMSYANEVETCMYAGGEKDETDNLKGWAQFPESLWLDRSLFSLKQDTKLLDAHIVKLGGRFLKEIVAKRIWKKSFINSISFKKNAPVLVHQRSGE